MGFRLKGVSMWLGGSREGMVRRGEGEEGGRKDGEEGGCSCQGEACMGMIPAQTGDRGAVQSWRRRRGHAPEARRLPTYVDTLPKVGICPPGC